MSNSIIIVIPTELLREIWLNSRGVGSKSFQHWSNLLAASPLTDPNIKQITFNRSSKASPKSSEGSVIRKKKKVSYLPSWKQLEAMYFWNSDCPLALFERPEFTEAGVEASRCLVSFQTKREENLCRTPCERKQSTGVMCMGYICSHIHVPMYTCLQIYILYVYARQRIWNQPQVLHY